MYHERPTKEESKQDVLGFVQNPYGRDVHNSPPFSLMMSVSCPRTTTHCASYETRVEEGWVHFTSTGADLL